jgi:hypothetical protein
MDDQFSDDRIQFFLRNRADIKAWAAIEPDVMAATRELLARSQPIIEEGLLAADAGVLVGRHDSGPFERIFARHEHWPETVGLALEWHRDVDPTVNGRMTIGVFWWADPPTLVAPRTEFVRVVDSQSLQKLGYRVPFQSVWPVGVRLIAPNDWWRDPGSWVVSIVERLSAAWPLVAHHIDAALPDNWQISRG